MPQDADVVAKAKEVLAKGDTFHHRRSRAGRPPRRRRPSRGERRGDHEYSLQRDLPLRQEQCRVNVFHVIPDYAMRADAIAQYLIWKKWPRWFAHPPRQPRKTRITSPWSSARPAASAARWSRTSLYDLPPGARNFDLRPPADPGADPDGDRDRAGP